MNKPHKHAETIIQWANGAKIQFQKLNGEWADCTPAPWWDYSTVYRVKPETKPDVVLYAQTHLYPMMGILQLSDGSPEKFTTDNVKFIIDGETGKLKSVELV